MKLYSGTRFSDFADIRFSKIVAEINSQDDSYILNVSTDEFTNYLSQKYLLEIPELEFDNVYVDTVEKNVHGSRFPQSGFLPDVNKVYPVQVFVYHIPYSGDVSLLQLQPTTRTLMSYDLCFDTVQRCALIDVINFYDNADNIKQTYDREVKYLLTNYNYLRSDCSSFNANLGSKIGHAIEKRKQEVLMKNNLLASLGVPIKKKDNVTNTFSIPSPRLREKIIVKPIVYESGFSPEPILDSDNYRRILKIINDVGKNFERLPSTYKGKREEDIRDHILLILDPNFEFGSASGETFNKIGKTDISLHYDSSVVFVAECKYWRGEKVFLKTIDQLLGYLTWRNSKVAIINFVQNSEFSDILVKIKAAIKSHPNFLKELHESDETWFNYKFHLNNDRNRELDMAVISFHLPK